jgi:hypothetical protein
MNLLRAASTISLLTLTSRITGLVRETMVAGLFGATAMTDAFLVAFRIPNLLRRCWLPPGPPTARRRPGTSSTPSPPCCCGPW